MCVIEIVCKCYTKFFGRYVYIYTCVIEKCQLRTLLLCGVSKRAGRLRYHSGRVQNMGTTASRQQVSGIVTANYFEACTYPNKPAWTQKIEGSGEREKE